MRAVSLLGLLATTFVTAAFVACSSKPPAEDGSLLGEGGPTTTPSPTGSNSNTVDPPPVSDDAGTTDAGKEPAASATIHFLGRFDTRDPAGPRAAWPGAEIRTRFSGTGATLRIKETGSDATGKKLYDQLEIIVDNGAPQIIKTRDDVESYEVAKDLPDGEHDLVIIKRTENIVGTLQFLGIESKEGRPLIATPPPSTRWIEFVGDSITCGYGVLGANKSCGFSADTESETLAYGALTAKALSASHTAIAWSGIGVYRNASGSIEGGMPKRYGRILPNDETSTWDFHITPDVVVVNLGTNDYTGGDPGTPYQTAMTDFAKTIRDKYPNAFIVLTVSSMMTDQSGWIVTGIKGRSLERTALQAVVKARNTAGDDRVSFFEFDEQSKDDGYGCGAHPSAKTQQRDADKLTAYLKTLTGW